MSIKYVAPIWPIGYAPLAVKPLLYVSFVNTSNINADIQFALTAVSMGVFDAVIGADMSFNISALLNNRLNIPSDADIATITSDVETLAIRNGGVKISIPMTSPSACATTINIPQQSYRYDGFV